MAATSALAIESPPTASSTARPTERLRNGQTSMIPEGWERMAIPRSLDRMVSG